MTSWNPQVGLVTASIIGLFAVGLWMIAFAPERWQRVVGQVLAFLATIQLAAVPFLWRAWRAQRPAKPASPR